MSPQSESTTLDPVVSYVSPNFAGWVKCFLVDVKIINSIFEVKSNSLSMLSVYPSPTYGSFSLGILGEHLVVEFLGGIFYKQTE
jgi:hypothetical protein